MENNMTVQNTYENNFIPTEEGPDFNTIKKKTAQAYNRTGAAMSLHFAILIAFQIVVATIFNVVYLAQGHTVDEYMTFASTNTVYLLALTAASYTVAHISAYFIGLGLTHRTKGAGKLFAKSKLSGKAMLFAFGAALGGQCISILLQTLTTVISGSSGMENMNTDMLSIGSDMTQNILLFLYMVIIGPVGEEIVLRGMALRNMTVSNRNFGIIMTAVMFGLFHGNIMQFFVGLVLGLLFAYVDVKAGSVIPSIILHVFNNALAFALSVEEYLLSESAAQTFELVYIGVIFVLGVIGTVMLIKTLKGTPDPEDSAYAPVYKAESADMKKLSVNLALKSPCLWIFTMIYIIYIIQNF